MPALSQDPGVYEELVKKHPHARSMVYHEDALSMVQSAREDILEAARAAGVPPEAVAGAMLDENTKIRNRGFGAVDAVQDFAVKPLPLDFVDNLPLDKVAGYVKNTPGKQRNRNLTNLPMWDIGPYNINVSYGYEIFEKQVLDPRAKNPLKDFALKGLPADATDEEKWNAYRDRCLLGKKGGAYVTAAVLREGQKRLAPYMRNSTPEDQAALLVTYFKQGWGKMQENYLARVKSTGDKSDMRPGEGARLFNNIESIQRILQGKWVYPVRHERDYNRMMYRY